MLSTRIGNDAEIAEFRTAADGNKGKKAVAISFIIYRRMCEGYSRGGRNWGYEDIDYRTYNRECGCDAENGEC